MKYLTRVGEREYEIEILDENRISVDGVIYQVDFASVDGLANYSLLLDGCSYDAHLQPGQDGWQVLIDGSLFEVMVQDEREIRLKGAVSGHQDGSDEHLVKAPMPGLVIQIPVEEGQTVAKGDVLVVIESMKMQNEVKSPRAGRCAHLRVKLGDRVEQRQTLLSITALPVS